MGQRQRSRGDGGDGHRRVGEGVPQSVEEAGVAQKFAVMREPDELGFVEQGVRLEA
jgi:hypothetical protein